MKMVDNGELENSLKCLWKKYADKNDIKIDQVIPMQEMYDCVECSGLPSSMYSCPNYINNIRVNLVDGDYR